MRKIERQMIEAIQQGRNWSKDNTEVQHTEDTIIVRLHGHCIAILYKPENKLRLDWCGWSTSTTRSRLNAVCAALAPDYGARIDKRQGIFLKDDAHKWTNIGSDSGVLVIHL